MLEEWIYGLVDEWFDWVMDGLVIDDIDEDDDEDDDNDDDDGGRDGGRNGCKVVYVAGLKMVEWLIIVDLVDDWSVDDDWIGCFDDGKSWASFIWSVKLELLVDDDAAANCVGERVSIE